MTTPPSAFGLETTRLNIPKRQNGHSTSPDRNGLRPARVTPDIGYENVPYSYQFTVVGGKGTVTWSLSGTLPTGLSLDSSTGILSGTPASATGGTYPLVVTATDSKTGPLAMDCVLPIVEFDG